MTLFPPRPAPQANYDWIDFVSATGYILFDGINAIDSTGDNYALIDSSHAANMTPNGDPDNADRHTLASTFIGLGAGPTKCADLDFDASIFQLPRTIEGTAFVGFSTSGEGVGEEGADNVYVVLKLRKYSGGESEIASVQSVTETLLPPEKVHEHLLKITVPKTHFKKGDHLRLTVEIWSTDTDHIALAHNPSDSITTPPRMGGESMTQFPAGNSRLTLAIPFKLDFM